MDDYKKIPFDDPDLCVPDLDDFDQMKEFFLDCAAEYFRYLSSDDMEKILYIDSEKYEQMEKELPRYGGTRFPPALAALSMDIIIPSSYICKMKAEINPKLSDREREHNSLNRTMHFKVADSRRNRLAQDRDKPRNITPRYDDDNRDSQ